MLTLKYLKTLTPLKRQEVILEEFMKCREDANYCISTYFTVLDPALSKRVPFKFYPHQEGAVEDFGTHNYNLTMKTRQMGLTTLTEAYVAWWMITKQNQIVTALANKQKTSVKFLKGVRSVLDEARRTAPWLIPDYMFNNNGKLSFSLKTGSTLTAEANTPEACRGETLNLLIIDEVAIITHMEDIWASAGITLTRSKGKCIAISCVTDDTFVFTENGPQQVKQFVDKTIDNKKTLQFEKNYKVLGKDKFREGNLFHYNGEAEIYKLSTTYTELKGSKEHKLWVYDNSSEQFKWKTLGEITSEDWVNINYNQQIWGNDDDVSDFKPTGKTRNKFQPKKLTPHICYLLGLYISEGSAAEIIRKGKTVGGTLCISCGDDVSKVFEQLNLKCTKYGIGHVTHSWELIQFMQYLGFDLTNKAPKKEIPTRLLSMSKENIKALLQGIFDGDGSSNSINGNTSLVSSSETLINQVRILLLNFGILSCKYKTTLENLNKNLPKGWYKFTTDSYSLQIFGNNALKYYEEVGFRLKRKFNNKKKLRGTTSQLFQLPGNKNIVNNLYNISNTSPWKLATYDKVYIAKNENHSISKTKQLIQIITNKNPSLVNSAYIKKIQEEVLIENSLWTKIKSIEILPEKQKVYDFSLPHDNEDFWCHSVIYNGILGHQTPKGSSGWYFDQYTKAEENGWNIVEAHWIQHPEYKKGAYQFTKSDENPEGELKFFNEEWPDLNDLENAKKYKPKDSYPFILDGKLRSPWYDFESKKLGPNKTKCELDCSFSGSGGEVIDSEIIRVLTMQAREVPHINIIEKGLWRTYREFKAYNPDHGYILSSDVATGDGSDFSTLVVIDITTKEVVATYKDQVEPTAFAKVLEVVGKKYGGCMLIVETQGPGLSVLMELKNHLRYPKIYYHSMKKKEVDKTQKRKLGFWQGGETRSMGGDKLEEVINTGKVKIYGEDIIAELHTWIWDKDGKRRHAPGKNDDLIMALSNAIFYIYFVLEKRSTNINMMKTHFSVERGGQDQRMMFL